MRFVVRDRRKKRSAEALDLLVSRSPGTFRAVGQFGRFTLLEVVPEGGPLPAER